MTSPEGRRHSVPAVAAAVGAAVFVLTTVLVWSDATERLDRQARDLFRPDDVWGPAQMRLGPLIDGFAPPRMLALLAVVTVAAVAVRRSTRPLLVALVLLLTTIVPAGAVKFAAARVDPHGAMSAVGGSYPSGHMVALIACAGGCLLVWETRVHWFLWVPIAALAIGMALALLYSAAHWLTDVVGGAALAVAALGVTGLLVSTDHDGRARVARHGTRARTGGGCCSARPSRSCRHQSTAPRAAASAKPQHEPLAPPTTAPSTPSPRFADASQTSAVRLRFDAPSARRPAEMLTR